MGMITKLKMRLKKMNKKAAEVNRTRDRSGDRRAPRPAARRLEPISTEVSYRSESTRLFESRWQPVNQEHAIKYYCLGCKEVLTEKVFKKHDPWCVIGESFTENGILYTNYDMREAHERLVMENRKRYELDTFTDKITRITM